MSLKRNVEVTCPNCLIKSNTKFWNSINVTVDEREKERLLANDFFKFTCPICRNIVTIEYDCLYHDMNKREMIYLIVNYSKNNSELVKELEALSEEVLPRFGYKYKLRIVTNNYDLIEKIKIFDCNLDDRIMEICKVYYISDLADSHPDFKLKHIYFDYDIATDNKIIIFLDDKGEVLSYDMNMKVYNFVKDKYLKQIEEKDNRSFQAINREWAIEIIEAK